MEIGDIVLTKIMKFKAILVFSLICLVCPASAYGIVYFRSSEGGKIEVTNTMDVSTCKRVIFRVQAKDELPRSLKERLLGALIQGEAVNQFNAAISLLKKNPGYCTYGEDTEKAKLK